MKCVIFANGEYGTLEKYRQVGVQGDITICADGGANYAHQLGIIPQYIVGDMDSIRPDVKKYFERCRVRIREYPRRKDSTDTQLALSLAEELGAQQIILLGTLGKRLDHSLSNLYGGIPIALTGRQIIHYAPDCTVYLVSQGMVLTGRPGDLVSILPLTERALGVCVRGFEYSLEKAVLENRDPYAISNILSRVQGKISVEQGVLAVFHFPQ